MKPPSKQLLKRLVQAVEWRSFAVGWHIIADRLETRPEVCRRWPIRYPDVWSRLMREAQLRRWEELKRTASISLDGLLRDPDPKIRERAHRMVVNYKMRKVPTVGPDGQLEGIWTRG
ncbi:MAG TPA: hypothetical protein VKD71_13965 [Gemmataceae bacterium]|nr:hypothetical protein [Gemmataceae bacterium]